jgi:hypothetical protein
MIINRSYKIGYRDRIQLRLQQLPIYSGVKWQFFNLQLRCLPEALIFHSSASALLSLLLRSWMRHCIKSLRTMLFSSRSMMVLVTMFNEKSLT